MTDTASPTRAPYDVTEAMALLNLSRSQIYELIRSDRLLTVTVGRRRLVPAEAIKFYVALLVSEAGMVTRRGRGEGGLYWNEARQRRMAMVDLGFTPIGKRGRAYISARTKAEVKAKLMAMRRDQADGLPVEQRGYTVREAVESWLQYGLVGREASTVENRGLWPRSTLSRPWAPGGSSS